jgi:hypothetical protein
MAVFARAVLVIALVVSGCSDPGETVVVPPDEIVCAAGELALPDGSCFQPGVAACAAGFVADDVGGCSAVLPEAPCPPGQLAVPGETTCHDVAPCGSTPWGTAPEEPGTQHVDRAYAGGGSDGSAAKPWTTVQAALGAAVPGAVIALAAGSYDEDVDLGIPVRLWGRCPAMVSIAGTGQAVASIIVRGDGTEIRDVAVTGSKVGVGVLGAVGVLVERVWIHDSGGQGIAVSDAASPSALTLRTSLVEGAHLHGILGLVADIAVEASVIRGTLPDAGNQAGRGIELDARGPPGRLVVRGSIIEHSRELGIYDEAAELVVDATLVRDQEPLPGDTLGGGGIFVTSEAGDERAPVTLSGVVLERNHDFGVLAFGSDVTVTGTTVRDTLPMQIGGRGISAMGHPTTMARSTLMVASSLVERSNENGILVSGSDATIEATIVRGTTPWQADGVGRGVTFQQSADTGQGTAATLRTSLLEGHEGVGLLVGGATVTVEDSAVIGTLPAADGLLGRGLEIQLVPGIPGGGVRSNAQLHRTGVEGNHEIGVAVIGADLVADGLRIRATAAAVGDGRFGDGLAVLQGAATAVVSGSRIEANARAGASVFGASLSLTGSVLECNPIQLAGMADADAPFAVEDGGGNQCGCGDLVETCHVASSSLEAPSPL